MNIVQFINENGEARPGAIAQDRDGHAVVEELRGNSSYELLWEGIQSGKTFADIVKAARTGIFHDAEDLAKNEKFLIPLSHPHPGHCLMTGTGLTHRKSAAARNAMHSSGGDERPNDSLKMYERGLQFASGVVTKENEQPEWFYKGNASCTVPSHAPLPMHPFSWSFGEEIELTGVYIVGPDGQPVRIGYCIANEASDHAMEGNNYLYLAHSKLRYCSLSAEIIVTDKLPEELTGEITISRGDQTLWSSKYMTGSRNMTHSFDNLEKHHFKYAQHRIPGDVHYYFVGASAMSYNDGISLKAGDVVRATADGFTIPLQNEVAVAETVEEPFVRALS